jgi:lycopene beta-cyclase
MLKKSDGWEIKLKNKKILLKNVIDSRPNKIFDDKYPSLKQVFVVLRLFQIKIYLMKMW